jgi:hypothetical protein
VPIIYANSGGPAQIFQDGVHGVSYEAGDFLQLAEALRCSITQNFAAHERAITAKNYVEACFTDTTFGGVVYDKLVQRLRLDEPLSRGTETPVLTLLKSKAVVT